MMTFSRLERIDVRHVTTNQPFYAGVILIHNDHLLVTVHDESLQPTNNSHNDSYRIGGIGGSQTIGETIWECAIRHAEANLSTKITLVSSPVTYFHDIDNGEVYTVTCNDTVAPFLFERHSNLYPYTPLRPGLPTGPYSYFGFFLAQTPPTADLHPTGNIKALLNIPLERWSVLLLQPPLATVLAQGALIIENGALPRSHQLWIRPDESFGLIPPLLKNYPNIIKQP